MAINSKNIINTAGTVAGQRVMIVDGIAYAVGIGGNFIPGVGSSVDLSVITAEAGDILENKVSVDKSGNPVYGSIKTVTPKLDGGTFTISSGYVAENMELNVHAAVVEYGENGISISSGYVNEKITVDFPQIEYAYADSYGNIRKLDLSGDAPADTGETIQSEAFLFALPPDAPECPSAELLYRCESVDETQKTWTGRKYVRNDRNGWTLGEDIFTLPYIAAVPQPGKTYNKDASLESDFIYWGFTANELLLTARVSLGKLINDEFFYKSGIGSSNETAPYLAAIINARTPILVSNTEQGAAFFAERGSIADAVVTAFEYDGNTYYYGVSDNNIQMVTTQVSIYPVLDHMKNMENVEIAKLMLQQFFRLGGSF